LVELFVELHADGDVWQCDLAMLVSSTSMKVARVTVMAMSQGLTAG